MTFRAQDEQKVIEAFMDFLEEAARIFLDEAERERLIKEFLKKREIK